MISGKIILKSYVFGTHSIFLIAYILFLHNFWWHSAIFCNILSYVNNIYHQTITISSRCATPLSLNGRVVNLLSEHPTLVFYLILASLLASSEAVQQWLATRTCLISKYVTEICWNYVSFWSLLCLPSSADCAMTGRRLKTLL